MQLSFPNRNQGQSNKNSNLRTVSDDRNQFRSSANSNNQPPQQVITQSDHRRQKLGGSQTQRFQNANPSLQIQVEPLDFVHFKGQQPRQQQQVFGQQQSIEIIGPNGLPQSIEEFGGFFQP